MTYEFQEPATAGVIVPVLPEMLCELGDTLREECHLDFSRAGVCAVAPIFGNDLGTSGLVQCFVGSGGACTSVGAVDRFRRLRPS